MSSRASSRIGYEQLSDGYEASFLVLGGDPLADPSRLHVITLRVKQGHELIPRPTPIPPLGGG